MAHEPYGDDWHRRAEARRVQTDSGSWWFAEQAAAARAAMAAEGR